MNHAVLAIEKREITVPELMAIIARSLVDVEDGVSVEMLQSDECTVLRLHVDPSDLGKVLGQQGRTARSLRTILIGAGMKAKRRFSLDIVKEQ